MLELPASRPARPGAFDRIGRYELITEIAQSPVAPLWAARVSSGAEVGRIVAIRRIARKGLDVASLAKLREAVAIATKIRGSNIVAVLDLTVDEHEVAIVSEYIEGEALCTVLRLAARRGVPLPIAVALRIGADLITTVRSAGELLRQRVGGGRGRAPAKRDLHGWLSPEFVLVAAFGDTMLTDLGLAGIGAAIPAVAEHADALHHSAPERLDSTDVDERADVFATGVVLWEMIAGAPLFGPQPR